MDVKVYIDSQCGYNFKEQINEYKKHWESIEEPLNKSKLVIVFSNNFEFIKGICKMYPKPNVVINITENLSEYHMANTLKYVSDICYFKSDVKTVVSRIMNTYKRLVKKGVK